MHGWVRKSRDSGGNVDMNDQPQCGRPVTANHYVNRQKSRTYTQKSKHYSESHSRKAEHWFSPAGFAHKKVCAQWMPCQLMPEMKTGRLETRQQLLSGHKGKNNDFLYSTLTGHKSWLHHYDPELKSQILNYRHPTSPRKKKSMTQPSTGKCMLTVFLGLHRHHSLEYMVQGMIINSKTYVIDPKEAETMNKSHLSEKKPTLLQHDNARSHTHAATSAAVESIGFEIVPHPPYRPDLALSDFWLFTALKKHLKSNHFRCDNEVQAATAKWFCEQPDKFYTNGFKKLVQHSQCCVE
jgi:histone-lysine N-methyltransferase SETMAR